MILHFWKGNTNLVAAGPSPVTPWNPWKPCGAPRPEPPPPAAALSALKAKLTWTSKSLTKPELAGQG